MLLVQPNFLLNRNIGAVGADTDVGLFLSQMAARFNTAPTATEVVDSSRTGTARPQQDGRGYDFDGVDDSITVAHNATLNTTGDEVSVTIKVKCNSSISLGSIVSKDGAFGSDTNYMLGLHNNQIYFDIYIGGVRTTLISAITFDDSKVRSIQGVYDGSTMKIFLDGVLGLQYADLNQILEIHSG
mgnify:CR=1 FL=1